MASLFASLFRRSEQRRAYAHLMEFDDRMLRDIGITRSDLVIPSGRRTAAKRHHSHE